MSSFHWVVCQNEESQLLQISEMCHISEINDIIKLMMYDVYLHHNIRKKTSELNVIVLGFQLQLDLKDCRG